MREATIEREHPAGLGGVQKLYRFKNGCGASVVKTPFSYGNENSNWELAVIYFTGLGNDAFRITYDTPVTDDVIGHLTEDEVDALLARIEALPATKEDTI